MTRFTRSLAASALALTMVLAPTGVAQAQSSFGSSSSEAPVTQQKSTEQRLIAAAESAIVRSGHRVSADANKQAEPFLQRALDGEFTYYDGTATAFTPNFEGVVTIYRIPNNEVEFWISALEIGTNDTGVSARIGVAAGSDDTHHYLVEVVLF